MATLHPALEHQYQYRTFDSLTNADRASLISAFVVLVTASAVFATEASAAARAKPRAIVQTSASVELVQHLKLNAKASAKSKEPDPVELDRPHSSLPSVSATLSTPSVQL